MLLVPVVYHKICQTCESISPTLDGHLLLRPQAIAIIICFARRHHMPRNQSINATWLPNWVELRAHFFQQIIVEAAEMGEKARHRRAMDDPCSISQHASRTEPGRDHHEHGGGYSPHTLSFMQIRGDPETSPSQRKRWFDFVQVPPWIPAFPTCKLPFGLTCWFGSPQGVTARQTCNPRALPRPSRLVV